MNKLIVVILLLSCFACYGDRRRAQYSQKTAAAGGYDPATDNDAIRWYRVEGTVGTNAANSSITNLVERKSVGYNFTNLTALANGPTISNNFLNGKAIMKAWGTNLLLHAIGSYSGVTEAHFFIYIQSDVDGGAGNPGFWQYNGASGLTPYYSLTDNDVYLTIGTSARKGIGNPTADITAWHLLEIITTSSEYTVLIDGVQEFTTASNTVDFEDEFNPQMLMNRDGTDSGNWKGSIAEIIVRNQKTTGQTLTDIRTYFSNEY